MSEKSREDYLELLRTVAKKEQRLPKKSDFSPDDVNRIKGFFGPWPWALEAVGLKESKQQARREKNRQKHLAAKEKRQNSFDAKENCYEKNT